MDGIVDSGITVMRLVRKLDAGPILMQRPWRMDPDKTAEELLAEAGEMGAAMIAETLRNIAKVQPVEQDDTKATFAPMLTREDGGLDFTRGALELHNRVRGTQPWPRASCVLEGDKRVIVHRSSVAQGAGTPGEVLRIEREGIVAACGEGALCLREVQLEGKPRMAAREAANGLRLKAGMRFAVPPQSP
jgi:methionyl-tRNA formyltransferase